MGALPQLGRCSVLMSTDLRVAETISFVGALETGDREANRLGGVAVIPDQCAAEVVDVRNVCRFRREDGESVPDVDEFRIIFGDASDGNGITQGEVMDLAERSAAAVG